MIAVIGYKLEPPKQGTKTSMRENLSKIGMAGGFICLVLALLPIAVAIFSLVSGRGVGRLFYSYGAKSPMTPIAFLGLGTLSLVMLIASSCGTGKRRILGLIYSAISPLVAFFSLIPTAMRALGMDIHWTGK